MSHWFEEQLEIDKGRSVKIKYNRLIESIKSPYQKIDVYDTVPFGKMLVHDNVIMLSEFDEPHYHEMIAHVALNTHPNPEKVLIIGGGDGGTMREVLKHGQVKEAHLCEIDEAVVKVARTHFPAIAGCFDDARVKLFFEDGATFLTKNKHTYDIIIVDSSDPVGPAETLFKKAFYHALSIALRADGIAVSQSESFQYHAEIIRHIVAFCRDIFPIYGYYYAMVPTYPSGVIGFSLCSKKYHPLDDIQVERAHSLPNLKYYNLDIHRASFVLPQFTKSFMT